MSETNYEQCHTSYRGYMNEEIDTAREMLRKYGKPCPDAVKELRLKTDMPMSECCIMLRCLWRDVELEHIQSENVKLREFAAETWELLTCNEPDFVWNGLQEKAHELGVEDR